MRLIGMLDSPYVRRVAISLDTLGILFLHEPISVFSNFDAFQRINPVVKAPTLVCDDGTVLMDSSLILQFIETAHSDGRSLWPREPLEWQRDARAVGLALAACEKAVQTVYERNLRPQAAQYEPWLERVRGQLLAAFSDLETEICDRENYFATGFNQAAITSAIAWQFTQSMLAAVIPASQHPALVRLSQRLESSPVFLKYPPDGPGVPSDA